MEDKQRIDIVMHLRGLASSRAKSKEMISLSRVYVDGKLVDKPSMKVSYDSDILVEKNENDEYVGRGATKLEKALTVFDIDVCGAVVADVGASTGGFTDYLLKKGAKKVYAIDVGHDQLHQSLRNDSRVEVFEGTNFRYIDSNVFKDDIDIISVDVSFISLGLILPKIVEISHQSTDIVVLIKPQFEAGKNNVGKKGIVKDKKIHLLVLNNINNYCLENGLYINGITFSPIKGGDGNIEYLSHLKSGNNESMKKCNSEAFKSLIEQTFELL